MTEVIHLCHILDGYYNLRRSSKALPGDHTKQKSFKYQRQAYRSGFNLQHLKVSYFCSYFRNLYILEF